jgi:serine/threonine protein kinase
VFALGALLYEMTSGQNPFTYDDDDRRALERVRAGAFPPLPTIAPTVPAGLAAVVARAMAADPEARYPSCGALRDQLEVFARGAGFALSPSELGRFVRERCGAQGSEPPAATLTHTPVVAPPLDGESPTTMPGRKSSPRSASSHRRSR